MALIFYSKHIRNIALIATILSPHIACILRSLADSDAFQSGRYAKHNGRPKTLNSIA